MEKNIIDKLFSSDELYFNDRIHANLTTKIQSVLLDRLAENLLEQAEYMVQATINDFLNSHLRNTIFSAITEVIAFAQKRIDNAVIYTETNSPLVFYEVKSFIKLRENRVKQKEIYQDILKLAIKKKELPYCEAYMLMAGRTEVLKKALVVDKSLILPDKFIDITNRTAITHDLTFFKDQNVNEALLKKAMTLKIKKISISPSRWSNYKGMAVLTWRINKI